MDKITPLSGDDFPVVFIGAGNIMFGLYHYLRVKCGHQHPLRF
jgi:hypothetical protein